MAKTVSDLTHTGQVNSFTGGLNTDLHPLVQPNDTLTDCINGTLITYNGNENMLQNDMGNYALEGSELPDGFIPLGMKEHNGVIYIVSQNPITEEVQIGSYPSPALEEYNLDNIDIQADPIKIGKPVGTIESILDNKNNCLFSTKPHETTPKVFDVELNIGDLYAINYTEDSNLELADFQHEQFFIESEDGKYTNIEPVIDGKEHPIDWDVCGKLGKKYVLNKITDFQQNVNFSLKKPEIISGDVMPLIVGGGENNGSNSGVDTENNILLPKYNFYDITISTKLSFDNLEISKINNSKLLVGALHKVISGNFYIEDDKLCYRTLEAYYEDLQEVPTTNKNGRSIANKTTFDSTYIIHNLWFQHKVNESYNPNLNQNQEFIYSGPIIIETYPIVVHRDIDNVNLSALCYDTYTKTSELSDKALATKFLYQYCTTEEYSYLYINTQSNGGEPLNMYVYRIDLNGDLIDEQQISCSWDAEYERWDLRNVVEYGNQDTVLFIKFNEGENTRVLPLIMGIDYDLFSEYPNFCLIPGYLIPSLNTAQLNPVYSNLESKKYIKINGSSIEEYDEKFSIYSKYAESVEGYYGDVLSDVVTISDITGKVTAELQCKVDGKWVTVNKQEQVAENGRVKFDNVIVAADVFQAVNTNKSLRVILDRDYLINHGHAPFAFQNTEQTWKDKCRLKLGIDDNLFKIMYDKCNWKNKRTIYINKVGGRTNNTISTNFNGDVLGNFTVNRVICYNSEDWSCQLNDFINRNDQLFVPTLLHVNHGNAAFWLPTSECNIESYYYKEAPVYLTLTTDNRPMFFGFDGSYFQFDDNTCLCDKDLIEKFIFGLYTHAFRYKKSKDGNLHIVDLKTSSNNLRYLFNVSKKQNINTKNGSIKLDINNVKNLIEQCTSLCNNFELEVGNYVTKDYTVNIKELEQSFLFSYNLDCIDQLIKDLENYEYYQNANIEDIVFWDIPIKIDGVQRTTFSSDMLVDKPFEIDTNYKTMYDIFSSLIMSNLFFTFNETVYKGRPYKVVTLPTHTTWTEDMVLSMYPLDYPELKENPDGTQYVNLYHHDTICIYAGGKKYDFYGDAKQMTKVSYLKPCTLPDNLDFWCKYQNTSKEFKQLWDTK